MLVLVAVVVAAAAVGGALRSSPRQDNVLTFNVSGINSGVTSTQPVRPGISFFANVSKGGKIMTLEPERKTPLESLIAWFNRALDK